MKREKMMEKSSKIIYLSLGIIFIIIFVILLMAITNNIISAVPIIVILGMLLFISILIILFLFIDENSDTAYKEVNDYYSSLRQSLILNNYKVLDANDNESGSQTSTNILTNILELMSINMKEIKDYYVLSKNMAKSSFRLSLSMCLLGFTLIASTILSIFILDVNLGSAIVPAIGGAIVEVVAGTSLFVYRQSLDQLNKYYEALHENERFLSVVNLADKMTFEKKDDVYMEIIRSQLNQKDIPS
ncbi:MAG: hypothetical protein WCD89_17015 [Anaerocolumna sp.]